MSGGDVGKGTAAGSAMIAWWSTLRTVQRDGSPAEKRALGGALLVGMFAIGVAVKTTAALVGYQPVGAADNPGSVWGQQRRVAVPLA